MSEPAIDEPLARARGFVAMRGDPLAQARLAAALGDEPREALLAALRPRQAKDGAFSGVEGVPGFAATLAALVWLDEARSLDAPEAARAVAWLEGAQREDGSWGASAEACDESRLVATGLLAGLLGKTACARPATLRRAGGFLGSHWEPKRVQGGDYGSIAAYACFFANTGHDLADAGLQWCGRELERGFRSGSLDALRTARVLMLCDAYSLPGARLAVADVVLSLLAGQSHDGGWLGGSDDVGARVNATVEAAVALHHLGRRG